MFRISDNTVLQGGLRNLGEQLTHYGSSACKGRVTYCLLLQTSQWHSIYHHQFHILCDTIHIKFEQIQWNITHKNIQYLHVFQGVIKAALKKMQNYCIFQHVKLLLLYKNTVIWSLSLSWSKHKYLCLYFMHKTIICCMTCQNFPLVS